MIALLVLFLFFIPAVLPVTIFQDWYLILGDLLLVTLAWLAFDNCPMRNWRRKVITSLIVITALFAMGYNFLIDSGLIIYGLHYYWIAVPFLIIAGLYFILPIRFDRLPNDELILGNYYEIIGKPKSHLQFILFLLTGGIGGSYSVTDGYTIIKMSKKEGKTITIDFEKSHLNNKKCILIGTSNLRNKYVYHSKSDLKFRLWRNCWWLSRRFKIFDNEVIK